MRAVVLLALIIIYTTITRFWQIDTLPPHGSSLDLLLRYRTSFASIISVWLVYLYARSLTGSIKISLLTAWTLAVAPWAIEQGRIYSVPALFLPVFLLFLICINLSKKTIAKAVWLVLLVAATGAQYLLLWGMQGDRGVASFAAAIKNFFQILSPSMLFVSNTTFWWGGVREFGIVFLSLVLFFFGGVVVSLYRGVKSPVCWLVSIGAVAALAPHFPEGRQGFLLLPFVCLLIAHGLYWLFSYRGKTIQLIGVFLCIVLSYEMIQFWHYYTIHYPMQVREHLDKIVQPY